MGCCGVVVLRCWAVRELDSHTKGLYINSTVVVTRASGAAAAIRYANFLFEGDVERLMPHLERAMEIVPQFGEVGQAASQTVTVPSSSCLRLAVTSLLGDSWVVRSRATKRPNSGHF